MKNTLEKYCTKKAVKNTAVVVPFIQVQPICICIPVHNEYPSFFSTLRSLHLSSLTYLAHQKTKAVPVSIICCVNARNSDAVSIRENNAKMMYELKRLTMSEYNDHPLLNLIVLDCSSDDLLFKDTQGAGLARKTAMDYAVLHGASVLACLDADTLVSSSYICCLQAFFSNFMNVSPSSPSIASAWALTGFSHQRGAVEEEEKAVRIYEDYLLEHSSLLYRCGTPYYPVALGPTIVCTAQAYAECGGMNTRCAGEDFYFLQALIKLHVHQDIVYLPCRVFPSSRISQRVPFGTGKKISEIIEGNVCRVFEKTSYEILFKFIDIFKRTKNKNPMEDFFHEVSNSLSILMPFLEQDGFFQDWQKIFITHHKSNRNLEYAFHDRFDGLKIIRMFHFLENTKQ
ncbi:MAG: hypothetical protein KA785_09435 [Spirochaetaceae bacterium]|nr:hypothetical protein [Spirochaetaceae bacterium]